MSYIETQLRDIGFSDKEVKVYLSAIQTGAITAQELSRKSGVNRATTYVMIDSLTARGLMSSITKGKKRLFVAEQPESIIDILKKEKREIEDKEQKLNLILPELKILSGTHDKPNVTFYDGEAGVEVLRKAIIDSNIQYIEEFSPLDEVEKYFPRNSKDGFIKNIKESKLIYTSSKGPILESNSNGAKRKYISKNEFPFNSDIAIYGSKVNIVHYGPKLISVLIDHEGISNTFHNLFALAWNNAENS